MREWTINGRKRLTAELTGEKTSGGREGGGTEEKRMITILVNRKGSEGVNEGVIKGEGC